MSTRRVASATSLAPQALKNSVPPPNVPVPKLNTGTFKPDLPSCRNSMANRCMSAENDSGSMQGVRFRTLQNHERTGLGLVQTPSTRKTRNWISCGLEGNLLPFCRVGENHVFNTVAGYSL